MKDSTYSFLMQCGKISGCHQRPDRSFMIRGRQFPICARCTGVYIGGFFAILTFRLMTPPIWLIAIFCLIMFSDWLIQYLKIKESTNIRRLVTGLFCGYGVANVQLRLLKFILTI